MPKSSDESHLASVDLKSDAELIDDRAASIRKQVELLEHWE